MTQVPKFYTAREVCERLRISDRTLKRRVAAGKINYYKDAGMTSPLKFTEQDIFNYISKNMQI